MGQSYSSVNNIYNTGGGKVDTSNLATAKNDVSPNLNLDVSAMPAMLDNPSMTGNVLLGERVFAPYNSSADVWQALEMMSLKSENLNVVSNELFGESQDVMNMMALAPKLQRQSIAAWSVNDAPGTLLAMGALAPFSALDEPRYKIDSVIQSPMELLQGMTTFWTGSLVFRIEVIVSKFHAGRLWFGMHYGTFTPLAVKNWTLDQRTGQYGQYLDIREGKCEFNISVDYRAITPWLRCSDSFASTWEQIMGYWSLSVVNSIVSPSTATSDVVVNIYKAAGPDFMLHYPRALDGIQVELPEVWLPRDRIDTFGNPGPVYPVGENMALIQHSYQAVKVDADDPVNFVNMSKCTVQTLPFDMYNVPTSSGKLPSFTTVGSISQNPNQIFITASFMSASQEIPSFNTVVKQHIASIHSDNWALTPSGNNGNGFGYVNFYTNASALERPVHVYGIQTGGGIMSFNPVQTAHFLYAPQQQDWLIYAGVLNGYSDSNTGAFLPWNSLPAATGTLTLSSPVLVAKGTLNTFSRNPASNDFYYIAGVTGSKRYFDFHVEGTKLGSMDFMFGLKVRFSLPDSTDDLFDVSRRIFKDIIVTQSPGATGDPVLIKAEYDNDIGNDFASVVVSGTAALSAVGVVSLGIDFNDFIANTLEVDLNYTLSFMFTRSTGASIPNAVFESEGETNEPEAEAVEQQPIVATEINVTSSGHGEHSTRSNKHFSEDFSDLRLTLRRFLEVATISFTGEVSQPLSSLMAAHSFFRIYSSMFRFCRGNVRVRVFLDGGGVTDMVKISVLPNRHGAIMNVPLLKSSGLATKFLGGTVPTASFEIPYLSTLHAVYTPYGVPTSGQSYEPVIHFQTQQNVKIRILIGFGDNFRMGGFTGLGSSTFATAARVVNSSAIANAKFEVDSFSSGGVQFQEAREPTSVNYTELPTSQHADDHMQESNWSISQLLERPSYVGKVIWSTGDPVGTVLKTMQIPFSLFKNSISQVPFNNFEFFRFHTIIVRFQINASPMHSGRLVAFYQPSIRQDDFQGRFTDLDFTTTLTSHVLLNPAESTIAELRIPFQHVLGFLRLTSTDDTEDFSRFLGYVHLGVFNKLAIGDGGNTSVDVNIVSKVIGLEMKVPAPITYDNFAL